MTSNHHTPLATATPVEATGANFNSVYGELDSAITNLLAGVLAFTQLLMDDGGELTIASGAITLTDLYHNVDTQGDASTDNLDTINGLATGKFAMLRANNAARDVVLTNGVGNILTVIGNSIVLNDTTKLVFVFHNGTNVIAMELGAGDVGAIDVSARATRGTGVSLPQDTWVTISYNIETYDTHSALSTTTYTVPTGFPGKYLVICHTRISTATGQVEMRITQNSTEKVYIAREMPPFNKSFGLSAILDCAAADTIQFQVRQNNASAPNANNPYFSIQYLGTSRS